MIDYIMCVRYSAFRCCCDVGVVGDAPDVDVPGGGDCAGTGDGTMTVAAVVVAAVAGGGYVYAATDVDDVGEDDDDDAQQH